MNQAQTIATTAHNEARGRAAVGTRPLGRCATVALAVFVIDIGTKMVATALLGDRVIHTGGATFLGVVHNDAFARGGLAMGSLTAPATLLLAAILLFVIGRVCRPLAAVDRGAPWGLGLVAGAAAANALDFVRTGRGVVDFLGVRTAHGSIVFNLADVAAYMGVVILARTAWLVARAVLEEQRLRDSQPRYARLHAAAEAAWARRHEGPRRPELTRAVPVFVEAAPTAAAAHEPLPRLSHSPAANGAVAQPELGDADLTVPAAAGKIDMLSTDVPTRPKLTLIVNRPAGR